MGKLQSFLQLGGVFADFAAAAPGVASTYLVNQRRSYRGRGRPRRASGRPRRGLSPGLAGSGRGPWLEVGTPEPACHQSPGQTGRIDLK
jgi:hypothetical protein